MSSFAIEGSNPPIPALCATLDNDDNDDDDDNPHMQGWPLIFDRTPITSHPMHPTID